MNLILPILKECSDACKRARGELMTAAGMLYQIRTENAWQGNFESFTAYVEDGCQMNRTQASRLITTYEHYVVNGGQPVSRLTGINPERLYLARTAGGDLDTQLSKAKTLSVSELRAENKESEPHDCEYSEFCRHCWARKP